MVENDDGDFENGFIIGNFLKCSVLKMLKVLVLIGENGFLLFLSVEVWIGESGRNCF